MKRHIRGVKQGKFVFYSHKFGKEIPCANEHEYLNAVMFELDPEVLDVEYEVDSVEYEYKGKKRTYNIDYTVKKSDGKHWIEAKNREKTGGSLTCVKAAQAREEIKNRTDIVDYSFIYMRDTERMLERLLQKQREKEITLTR